MNDPAVTGLFQRYANLAARAADAPRASADKIHFLQTRLCDSTLDIRQLRSGEGGLTYWAILRWDHPTKILGKLATLPEHYGLDKIPVIVKWITKDDGSPRELVERDLMTLVRAFGREKFHEDAKEENRSWEEHRKNGVKLDADVRSELEPQTKPRSYANPEVIYKDAVH